MAKTKNLMQGIYFIEKDKGSFIATNIENPEEVFNITEQYHMGETTFIKTVKDKRTISQFVIDKLTLENQLEKTITKIHKNKQGVGITFEEEEDPTRTTQDNKNAMRLVRVNCYGIKNGSDKLNYTRQVPKDRRKYTKKP